MEGLVRGLLCCLLSPKYFSEVESNNYSFGVVTKTGSVPDRVELNVSCQGVRHSKAV